MTFNNRSYHSSDVLIKERSLTNTNLKNNNVQVVNSFNDHGFSLIEAMIALAVMLIGMLGVMGMQYYAITGNTSSREMRIATNLALESLEQTKSMSYSAVQNGSDTPYTSLDSSISGGLTSFARRWWVVPDCLALNLTSNTDPCNAVIAATCDGNGDPDSSVTVAVSAIRSRTCWQDKNSNYHSVTIDSLRWNENVTP